MNILVIGGSGLFGRKTVFQLLKDEKISYVVNMDVVPLPDWTMKLIGQYSEKYRFVRGDVSEIEDILNAVKSYSIDRLVNLAFLLPGDVEDNPRLSVKVNQLGMCNAFEAARLMGISRVVYASSEGVYGPQDFYGDREVTEDDTIHPQSPYAVAKQQSEMLAGLYSDKYGMNLTAIRPPIGFGHGGRIPDIIRMFSEIVSFPAVGKPFSTESDGKDTHGLSSADDIGILIDILVKADKSPHPAYNVAGPPYSLTDVADIVRGYLPDAVIEFGNRAAPPDRGKQGIPWKLSSARAKDDFGFTCMPLEEAVLIHINDARTEAGMGLLKD